MKSIWLLIFSLPLLAVDGTVVNQTTGKPQAGVTVTMVKLGQGMETVGSTSTDAQGKFSFAQQVEGPRLLQAQYQGVNYNRMLPPNVPGKDIALEVYESSKQPGDAKVSNHMILLEADGKQINVTETIFYNNTGKTTYNNPGHGTVKFYLPPETNGEAKVQVTAPNGMPIARPAEKTSQANVYAINYPVKPGETRFDLSYALPGDHFKSRILHSPEKTHLVAPKGLTLQSPDLTSVGSEPTTQAQIFDLKSPAYDVAINGTGVLRAADNQAASQQEDQAPAIQEVLPKVYDRLYWVLGLSLAILAVGFVLMLSHQQQQQQQPATKGKRA